MLCDFGAVMSVGSASLMALCFCSLPFGSGTVLGAGRGALHHAEPEAWVPCEHAGARHICRHTTRGHHGTGQTQSHTVSGFMCL